MAASPHLSLSRRGITQAVLLVTFFLAVHQTTLWIASPDESMGQFGFLRFGGNGLVHQDFAVHQAYLHSIALHRVAHPYRVADQATLSHLQFPFSSKSLLHAYSPVALFIDWPFLRLPSAVSYYLFSGVSFAAIAWLWSAFLLPRIDDGIHLVSLAIAFLNVRLADLFSAGQTTLITTALLGWTIIELSRSPSRRRSLGQDAWLAAALILFAIKPNFALVLGTIYLGEKRWRAIAFACAGLLLIWAWAYPFYGGWWQGLIDYGQMLSGFDAKRLPAYFQDLRVIDNTIFSSVCEALDPTLGHDTFKLLKYLFFGPLAVWLVLRWRGLAPLIFIPGVLWTFLLFSPYLGIYEDWLLVILVAMSRFYAQERLAFVIWMILIVVLNLAGANISGASGFLFKLLLALGWLKFEIDQGHLGRAAQGCEPKNRRDPAPQVA